jgi:hypothetical protein
MSKLLMLTALAGLLVVVVQTEASAGFGSSGIGGIAVWQTPENEPGAQARREAAEAQRASRAYGRMQHHSHHRHHHHTM